LIAPRRLLLTPCRLLFAARRFPIAVAVAVALLVGGLVVAPALVAQPPASSSSSSTPESQAVDTTPVPRIAQPEAGGSAFTLETSEPLFTLAAALNACGYDAGLAESDPVRLKVREQINQELAASAAAREARDAVCGFIREHALTDTGRDVAQYISLSLYLTPAPELAPSVEILDLPPEAAPVVEILPLLRAFADAVHLNAIWIADRPEYEALIEGIHDPLTKVVLDTNIFLRLPVSTYDGRRFLVLLEPMLAPEETNARYNGADSVVVVSPRAGTPDTVPMDLIRHTYLHFLIEPLIYTRTSSINRLQPLLKPVQKAPLEFTYKSDIVALVTECLIKAVEAQTMDVGIPLPVKPGSLRERVDQERYETEMSVYDRQAEVVRRRRVDLDMRQGWVLVDYFYNQLGRMQKEGTSIKDNMGPMVYGMDVERERHHDEQIAFLPTGSGGDVIRRTPRPLTGLDLAESKLMKGDLDGAGEIADAALKANPANPQALYLLGRIDLMQGDPDGALDHLTQTVKLSHDPRTVAWAHIYLGRMYDIAQTPQRDKALAEYRAALANRDSQTDTKAAAERGIQQPFALPKRAATSSDQQENAAPSDEAPLDPTGKAEKEAYRPSPSK
jgi:tetratricopeptide (TPR) repeat protein